MGGGRTHVRVADQVRHDVDFIADPPNNVGAVSRLRQLLHVDGLAGEALPSNMIDAADHHTEGAVAEDRAGLVLGTHILSKYRDFLKRKFCLPDARWSWPIVA